MADFTAKGSDRRTITGNDTLTVSGRGMCLIKVADGATYGGGSLVIEDDLAAAAGTFDGTLDSSNAAVSLSTDNTGTMVTINAPPSVAYKVKLTVSGATSPSIPVGVHFDQLAGV